MEPSIPEHLRQEMRALAEAAEVEYDDIVLLNVFGDALVSGCTSILVGIAKSMGEARQKCEESREAQDLLL